MNARATLLIVFIVFFSCTKKDEDEKTPTTSNKIEYKDQDLQGEIDGKAWIYAQGGVNSTAGGFNSDFEHNFNIVDTIQADSCFANNGKRPKAIFAIFDNESLLKVGKQPLLLDFTSASRTITLVSYSETTVNNIVCSEGEYEILGVDTINKKVTGRMDVKYDKENYLNGNFELKYCFWNK